MGLAPRRGLDIDEFLCKIAMLTCSITKIASQHINTKNGTAELSVGDTSPSLHARHPEALVRVPRAQNYIVCASRRTCLAHVSGARTSLVLRPLLCASCPCPWWTDTAYSYPDTRTRRVCAPGARTRQLYTRDAGHPVYELDDVSLTGGSTVQFLALTFRRVLDSPL